jgi:hypothetical protein
MKKIIRKTYPIEFSAGLLLLIFLISFFLSSQIFDVPWRDLIKGEATNAYVGMSLVSFSVIVVVLILWEEFLFPVKVKPGKDGVIFRHHRTKLKTELLIFCLIPAIYIFVYFNFEIHIIRFLIWGTICTIVPIIKLSSGVNNYNDFLRLADENIEYRNNQKSGVFQVDDIQRIKLMRDENDVLHKLEITSGNNSTIIDLDEMELEAFLDSIDQFMVARYNKIIS